MASLALATAFGCGGKAQTVGSAGSGGAMGGKPPDDASVDAPESTSAHGHVTIGCPATPPSAAAPCPQNRFCEYGSDWDPRCNTIFLCDGASWGQPIHVGGDDPPPVCGSSVAPTVGPNPADCPATRSNVTPGQTCTGSSTCTYGASNCTCGHYCPSFPIQPPPCNPDAGVNQFCCDLSGPPTWNCFDGPAYCTTNRPSVGDPCTDATDSCAITPAVECGQTTLNCGDGTWRVVSSDCPVSTARAKRDISYLGPHDVGRLRDALLGVKLATYKYNVGDPSQHLGFIIEDMPNGSPAVLASRQRVDLYGYLSMAVAAIQQQQRQIDLLERRLERAEHDACKPKP